MLKVTDLYKQFQGHEGQTVRAVDGVSFAVPEGKLFTLLGPSGCGKTTTLRCIAGLEQAHAGEIHIGNRAVFSAPRRIQVPASDRDIGMVFQSYAIWPHMNVYENVAFPLRVGRNRYSRREIQERVSAALERVHLSGYEGRDATKLSGGQQQRLALARALVREPRLLLLDEPLSNLDAKLRESMRFELKRLQRDLGITSLYVTHDQIEALALSNYIAVMRNGQIQQVGTPREIYEHPANQFVADFIGSTNFIRGELAQSAAAGDPLTVAAGFGPVVCGSGRVSDPGAAVLVSVRPEHTLISADRPAARDNIYRGEVVNWVFLGESTDFQIAIDGQELRVRAHPDVEFHRGSAVWVHLPPHRCVALALEHGDAGTGAATGEVEAVATAGAAG